MWQGWLNNMQWAHWHPPIFGLFLLLATPNLLTIRRARLGIPIISNLKKLGLNADLILVVKFLVLLGRMMFHHKFRISFSSHLIENTDSCYSFC
jgi:hypothetical protein